MAASRFFAWKNIFLFVYFLTTIVVTTLTKKHNRFAVNENILRQLRTLKTEENKFVKNEHFIKNVGKRAALQNNGLLDGYFDIKAADLNKNTEENPKEKRQIIAPGYYEAECSDKKPCKSGKYCNLLYCEDCHKEKTACTRKKQCCSGMVCTYGRCEKKSKGDAGTFCEKDSDCKSDSCCVLEPTVNTLLPICKPKLDEYHQCASILYRKVWIGEKPDCGPCKQGLECTQKGILASHQICLKPSK